MGCIRCTDVNITKCDECAIECDKLTDLYLHLRKNILKQIINDELDTLRELYNKHANKEKHDVKQWNIDMLDEWNDNLDELFVKNYFEMADAIVRKWIKDRFNYEI